jgi:hypothetical protein
MIQSDIVVILTISMCSLADDVEITDSLSLSISLSVVAVLDHRYLLKHWPMKELGIALAREENKFKEAPVCES